MINEEEKIYLINLKLNFWKERLLESNQAAPLLDELGDQVKINSNVSDIDKYTKIIESLEIEKEALTNQG